MPLSQTLDSVASARKRRNLHPRACECECECDCDSIRVCKRQKKIENLVYKGLRSRGRCNPELDLSGDKGEKEGEKEDHSKICSAQGQRRSLRIRENFRRHGHLEINKDCHTQREKREGLKVDKRGSKGEKKEGVKAVKKEESKAGKKEGLKAEHRSTRASYNGVDTKHVESWNYRIKCRGKNELISKEPDSQERIDNEDVVGSSSSESIDASDGENQESGSHKVTGSKDNRCSSSSESVDALDGGDSDNKPDSTNPSMRNTVVPDILEVENDAICHDSKFHLEVMLVENAVHEPKDEIPSPEHGLKTVTSQCTGTVVSQNHMNHGEGMVHNKEISDSEDSSRDLGGQTKLQNAAGSSMLVPKSTNVIAHAHGIVSKVATANVDEMSKHADNTDPFEHSDRHQENAQPNAAKDVTEPGDRHGQDAQTDVVEDITQSNDKHLEMPLQEGAQETTEIDKCDLNVKVKHDSDESSGKQNHAMSFKFDNRVITEGRKCGLCGVGNDGKPPKKLFRDTTDSDNEMSGELQATTEETKYQDWDGFGDEAGWLGHLLGPLSDRFGIAGVWVHRQCAVWSPEVYFSGVGCLKNVRAALSRGRSLKCSRCGRPGATIGCRVDRCPRTYHLACGRAEGCVFDHRKYLMACTDHLHMFRPRGGRSRHDMQKMRFRRMVMERRKASTSALRKDLEAEEKCLENCGDRVDIFFDEIDGLAPKRSRQQDQTHSSVVSTLLALMDGLKSRGSVVVIGATNRPGDLDPALRRPGRFDREIYFPLPSVKDRAAILGVHTRKWPKPASGDILSSVAKQTPGYAGADLQALCTQAAMIALKRKFPLQELLCSAERNSEDNQLPSIPPFTVKESDWATAIAQAPPPCSRRAGSMVINDVIAVPLQRHMVPALLQPLVELLFSLYLDGRIVLPPILSKAAMLIQSIIRSTLEEKCLLTTPCCSSLCSMLSGSSVAKDIERSLSAVGLIYDGIESLSSDCLVSSPCEDITGDVEDSDVKSDEAYSENMEKLKSWRTKGKGVGFRVLIAGDPKVGQKYLASCILHGFEGNVEIRKLNLSTMSQEGHGDIIQGLTHILGNCLSIGPCVIFMPRIESWALEKMTCESFDHDDERSSVPGQDILQEQTDVVEGDGVNGHSVASQAWNVLVQQVDTITSDVPLVLLATCGLPGVFLPLQIRNFFGIEALNASSSSITSKQTIPCFTVQLPTTFDCKLLFDQSAKSLTRVLIRRYIQFIHEVSHGDCIALRKSATSSSHGKMDARQGKNKIECHSQACTDRVDASLDDKKKTCNEDTVSVSLNGSHSVASQHQNLEDGYDQKEHGPNQMSHRSSYQGAGKGKTALQLAIATCGYQLLRYPQFAELCWVTSKLDEGPCTTIDGPWKGWPFNSCIVNESRSQQEVPSGDSSSEHKDTESSSVVRGLVAVGLLAYKGLYNTGKEVACEVRRVLELLIRRVKTKIQSGKDRYQFFPLLAQAASLEDMVNSWAYAIKRCLLVGPKCLESISMNRHFHDGKKCPQFFSTLADRNGGDIDPTGKIVDSNNLSNFHMQCVYHCCAECIHTVHLMVKQFLINCWKAEGCCSSLEDIHDLVASCTVHVLAVMAQLGGSDTDEVKDLSGKQESMLLFDKKSCSCQDTCHARPMGISRRETGDNQMMGMPSRREANLGTMERMLRECKCHASPRRKNARRRHGPDASWLETTLNFVFTDNVCNSILKSLDGAQDLQFHCQTEHVCFCSLIQRLSTIQQPLRLLHL